MKSITEQEKQRIIELYLNEQQDNNEITLQTILNGLEIEDHSNTMYLINNNSVYMIFSKDSGNLVLSPKFVKEAIKFGLRNELNDWISNKFNVNIGEITFGN